jgi:ABC-2 type transport system ATP-binding protein
VRVAIIDHGSLLACDTVDQLKKAAGADTVISVTYDATAPAAVEALRARAGVNRLEVSDGHVRVFTRHPDG